MARFVIHLPQNEKRHPHPLVIVFSLHIQSFTESQSCEISDIVPPKKREKMVGQLKLDI